jgi:hypothetical protein
MTTENWTAENYFKHVVDNKLDMVWSSWCNPKVPKGIRLIAYHPIFPANGDISYFEKKCKKQGCGGTQKIPLDDIAKRVIYMRKCNGTIKGKACGSYKTLMYRWTSSTDTKKLCLDNPNVVRRYGKLGRTFYATNMIYDKKIVPPKAMYVDQA